MALAQTIIDRIRDEIGPDLDVTDETPVGSLGIDLETIFNDVDRGNSSILVTALIVWRNRLAALQARAFDATVEGSLVLRSQRVRMIERQIHRLEGLVDSTDKGANQHVLSSMEQFSTSTEFSS